MHLEAPIFAPTSNNDTSISPTESVMRQTSATPSNYFECSPNTSLIEVAKVIEECIRAGLELNVDGIDRVYVYELCTRTATNPSTGIGFNVIISSCVGCEEAATMKICTALESIIADGSLANDINNASKGEIQATISAGVQSTYDVLTDSQPSVSISSSPSYGSSRSSSTYGPSLNPMINDTESPSHKRSPAPSQIASLQSPTPPVESQMPSKGTYITDNPTTKADLTPSPAPIISAPIISANNSTDTTAAPSPAVSNETVTKSAFYPDWYGNNLGCLSDGNPPEWITANPSYYMSDKLEVCCIKVYQWNCNSCAGLNVGTGKWYMKYSTGKCVKDCEGGSECGGNAEAWYNLWESKLTCCLKKTWWDVLNC
jgi:hypothetical protein